MNPIIERIQQHRTVRKYKTDPVPEDLVRTIVNAGQRASTSSNLQMYSVVVTRDPDERTFLASRCGNQKHILDAPVFLTWCADLSRLDRICRERGFDHKAEYVENFLLAVVDVAIASQNAGLAAESLDLGFCYIGGIRNNPKDIIDLLHLPRLVFPLVGMTLGWPDGKSETRLRLPLDEVLHWDKYDCVDEESLLDAYDKAMIETGIYEGRQIADQSQLRDSEYGWREHSARRVSQIQRPHLKSVLEGIGYSLK